MKLNKWLAVFALSTVFHGAAFADDGLLTAHLAADGSVVSQSPQWISSVDHQAQDNYFSLYKLNLDTGVVGKDPRFCSVSPIDASTYERQLHGQAKVIGKPVAEKIDVMTQLVDKKGPSGDNSLEFLVMCSR